MGLFGFLIAVLVIILFFVFSRFSNSPSAITPKDSKNIQTQARDAVNSEMEKKKLEQNQIKNIDSP